MEDVYPRVPHTTTRELYLRELGGSRVAYVPWDIVAHVLGRAVRPTTDGCSRNLVRWTANEPAPVEVDGPGLVDVAIWRQRSSITVHLVNLTNPMMFKGPLREVLPIGPLRVRVRMPGGSSRAPCVPAHRRRRRPGGAIRQRAVVTVPSVGVHEVIAIDI